MLLDRKIVDVVETAKHYGTTKIEINGWPLYIRCGDDNLTIRSENSERAEYYFEVRRGPNGLLNIAAFTYIPESAGRFPETKQRYPGLRAKELIELSVEYFEKQGKEVRGIHAKWYKKHNDTNISTFLDAKKRGKSDIGAAKETWTGQVAQELGFSAVERVDDVPDNDFIEFLFLKPTIMSLIRKLQGRG